MIIRPGTVHGQVAAPGSKSVTHRAFLLAAQSTSPCTVASALLSADTLATLAGMQSLGAAVEQTAPHVRFRPAGLRLPTGAIDCQNAGTALRLLTATSARLGGSVLLTGDASLRSRPNDGLLTALAGLGVRVESQGGRAPLRVQGPLRSGIARLPAKSSSQFASALLLALPFVAGDSTLVLEAPIASRPYLDVTLRIAHEAGLRLDAELDGAGPHVRIPGAQQVKATRLTVPGDWSSAAFPLAAAALTGGRVTVTGLDPRDAQGDRAIVDHLRAFGARVEVDAVGVTCSGEDLRSPGLVDIGATPDLFPVLAVVAAASRGTTTFVNGASLRHKETDRIRAMARGLATLGIAVQERPDGLTVHGGELGGGRITSLGDHRIHMAFAIAGLAANGPVEVDDPDCAAVSYPAFHEHLRGLGGRVEVAA